MIARVAEKAAVEPDGWLKKLGLAVEIGMPHAKLMGFYINSHAPLWAVRSNDYSCVSWMEMLKMYAIISVQGQQFRTEPGAVLAVNRMDGNPGEMVELKDSVLFAKDDAGIKMGVPVVKGAKVQLEILEHYRGDKITVFKMKRRKHYRRTQGHRQELTRVRVKDIALS